MSAITGIFYREWTNVNPELIKKINNSLSHRGPDGSSIWYKGPYCIRSSNAMDNI